MAAAFSLIQRLASISLSWTFRVPIVVVTIVVAAVVNVDGAHRSTPASIGGGAAVGAVRGGGPCGNRCVGSTVSWPVVVVVIISFLSASLFRAAAEHQCHSSGVWRSFADAFLLFAHCCLELSIAAVLVRVFSIVPTALIATSLCHHHLSYLHRQLLLPSQTRQHPIRIEQ